MPGKCRVPRRCVPKAIASHQPGEMHRCIRTSPAAIAAAGFATGRRAGRVFGVACALALSSVGFSLSGAEVTLEPDTVLGPVKPVNGVGQPPMIGRLRDYPMFHYLTDAGIPYSRLHDVTGWLGGGLFVDIPNLFPDFDADENDPSSYRFAYTDSLMKALEKNGVEPFFRLGVTIENFVLDGYPPVNTLPPKDYAKWGRICEHVIRHYTEGWANGFRMKVTYWEIWNEPENHPDDNRNPMFGGPFTEYMRLYGTVAPYLKAKFPHLKIGGYGHCGFYAGVGSEYVPAAKASKPTTTVRMKQWHFPRSSRRARSLF